MREHIAHIRIDDGVGVYQTVAEHCIETAKYAFDSLEQMGLGSCGYISGLLHDCGKLKQSYQDYLIRAVNGESVVRGSVNHTFAGVIYVMNEFHKDKSDVFEKMTSEIIAIAIGAHHGEFDVIKIDGKGGFDHRLNTSDEEIHYSEAIENFFKEVASEDELKDLFLRADEEVKAIYNEKIQESNPDAVYTQLGFLARIVLSAVIEGDRRSTGEFMESKPYQFKKMKQKTWMEELGNLESKIEKFDTSTEINQVRADISDQCKAYSKCGNALVRLSVPTGGGKTLSALRYSLSHAAEYGKSRIVFIIPLLSIIEQNSAVIKDNVKNKSIILEHHSNVVNDLDTMDAEELKHQELLTDSWESPIIVSTLFQMLEILFSHKTMAIRRMKSLINSIIVFDEIQSIPVKFTYLFDHAINFLVNCCNATVVLSSATQPCFDILENPIKFSVNPEMVKLSKEQLRPFQRVELVDKVTPEGMTLEELGDFVLKLMMEKHSVLVVCNTKSEAKKLYNIFIQNCDGIETFHLSAAMCPKHREVVLGKIGKTPGYNDGRKVICVSTQLVEAGIDFSFESVIRIKAGLDSVIQAIGRCNRSGEWGHICESFVVNLKNEKLGSLGEIKTGQKSLDELLYSFYNDGSAYDGSLTSEKAVRAYYTGFYNKNKITCRFPVKIDNQDYYITDMLSKFSEGRNSDNEKYVFKQPFKTAHLNCTIFDDDTVDVIVNYDDESKKIIENLTSEKAKYDIGFAKGEVKKAKQYTVSLHKSEFNKLQGVIYALINESIFILDNAYYSKETGISLDERVRTPDFFVS